MRICRDLRDNDSVPVEGISLIRHNVWHGYRELMGLFLCCTVLCLILGLCRMVLFWEIISNHVQYFAISYFFKQLLSFQ